MSKSKNSRPWDPHITVATIIPEPTPSIDPKTSNQQGANSQEYPAVRTQRFLFVEEQINNDITTNQPAGHLEPHESLFDAAIRETLEETGWHVELTHFIGVYVYRPPTKAKLVGKVGKESQEGQKGDQTLNNATYFRFCFSAKAINQISNVELDHGIIRPLWLSLDELNAKERTLRSPLVKQCVIDYQAGQLYPLSTVSEWIE